MAHRSILSLLAVAASVTEALTTVTATKNSPLDNAAVTGSAVYTGLSSTPLVRALDNKSVFLPDLWKADTPFGIADEFAVCAFLRHYGWFLCWEHANALKERVLPAVQKKGGKLFFIGVGTGEAAAQFASQLDIDPSLCFGDDGGAVGESIGLEKGFKTMWNPPAVDNMMARNDEQSLKTLGEAYKGAVDAIGFQNLAPKKIQDTLRQGGTFVFKGDRPLLDHVDAKVGDNCEIEDILFVLN